jgi:hypothetical protein
MHQLPVFPGGASECLCLQPHHVLPMPSKPACMGLKIYYNGSIQKLLYDNNKIVKILGLENVLFAVPPFPVTF